MTLGYFEIVSSHLESRKVRLNSLVVEALRLVRSLQLLHCEQTAEIR